MKTAFSSFIYSRRGIYGILHILILLMSLFLVISISIDTFHPFPESRFLSEDSVLDMYVFPVRFPAGVFPLERKRKILHQPFYFPAGIYTLFKYH